MEKANIERINELTRISRERALTELEQAERKSLREAYIRAFKDQMRQQLDHTVIEYPDHHREPLNRKKR